MWHLNLVLVVCFLVSIVSTLPTAEHNPKNLIIDSDFLSFPDDAGAIGLANAFQQLGKARILGIASNLNSRFAIPGIDAINTYYGHPDIPFAQNRSITNDTAEPDDNPPTPIFVTTLANTSLFPEDIRDGSNSTIQIPLEFYRHILSGAKDKSVTILSIGFFTNLAELYHSEGGKKLIEDKVVELVVQGGDFSANLFGPNNIGYNLGHSLAAAKVLESWPSPVTFLGDDIGPHVLTGEALENTPVSNPVKAAYEIFLGGAGRSHSSWDILAAFYGVLGISEGSFQYGNEGGRIEIHDNATTVWKFDAVIPHTRRQHFLNLKDFNVTIAKKINHILSLPPI